MSSVSTALGNEAAKLAVVFEGQSFTVSPLTFAMLTELEMWMLEKRAEAQLQSDLPAMRAGLLSRDEVLSRKDAVMQRAIDESWYAYGSEKMAAVYGTAEAASADKIKALSPGTLGPVVKLFSIMLRCDEDTAVRLLHAKGHELVTKIQAALAVGAVPKDAGAEAA